MVRKEELQNAVFKSYINEEAQMSAYNSGYTEAKYESIKKAEGRVKTEKVKGGFTVTVPLSNEALTESRKTAIEFFKVVAEVANANIKVVEDAKNHGLYDPKTNTISIDVNLGGKDFMVYSLSHELTHRIREMLPEQFDDFAKMLFEAVGEKMSVTERIKLWEKNNKQYYPKLTSAQLHDRAYEEVVCEMCESFLTDEAVARKFSEKVQKENKTLWEKIKDFFTDLINRLTKAYEGLDPQSENGRLVREMTNDLTKVKEAWAELVIESGKVEMSTDSMRGHTDGVVIKNGVTSDLIKGGNGKDALFSKKTELTALPKQAISLSTGEGVILDAIGDIKPTKISGGGGRAVNGFTGRDVRAFAMRTNGFTVADINRVNEFMDAMSDFMEEAGVTYRFIGLQDVEKAQLHYSYNPDGSIKSIVLSAMVKNGDYPVNFD